MQSGQAWTVVKVPLHDDAGAVYSLEYNAVPVLSKVIRQLHCSQEYTTIFRTPGVAPKRILLYAEKVDTWYFLFSPALSKLPCSSSSSEHQRCRPLKHAENLQGKTMQFGEGIA